MQIWIYILQQVCRLVGGKRKLVCHALIETDKPIHTNREKQTGHTMEAKTAETLGIREESCSTVAGNNPKKPDSNFDSYSQVQSGFVILAKL